MATYNEQILQSYFDKRDWGGAADYLSGLTAANPQKQNELNNQIRELRRNANIQNAILSNMDLDTQQAYHFMSAVEGNGNVPHTENGLNQNSYGDNYLEYINGLKVNNNVTYNGRNIGGSSINRIRISIDSETGFQTYLDNLGMNTQQLTSLGINYRIDSNTGKVFVDIPTNNLRLRDMLQTATTLTPVFQGASGTGGGGYPMNVPQGYEIKGLTTDNLIVAKDNFNYDNVRHAMNVVYNAQQKQQKALAEQQSTVDEEMYITPFLGQGHANAYKRMQRGLITIDEYNKIVKERTDAYNRILRGSGLSQYRVFQAVGDGENAMLLEEVPNEKGKRDKITEYILSAMDDNRLSYQAAMHGGEVGTYITISPKVDAKGEKVEGEYGQFRRIFIPGLFKSSCDETFNNDTQQMSVRDNADMKHWNYGKSLNDGNYVGYDPTVRAYKLGTDTNGSQIKIPITESEMLQLLNRENIVNQSVQTILSAIDENGNPRNTTVNGKTVTFDIEEQVKNLSIAGVNECYPKGNYSDEERLRYQNEIYNTIMEILSSTFYSRRNNQEE